jgi:C-terminal processing protease CtpA/Prc
MSIKTPYTSELDGRGIFPDVEIEPTIEDRMEGNDLELQWILNDIKGLK